MCKWKQITLSNLGCKLTNTEKGPHRYQKYTYWLCKNSRNGEPCSSLKPKDPTDTGLDVGSRQDACPICAQLQRAADKYEEEYNAAQAACERRQLAAWEQQQEDLKKAEYVAETVRLLARFMT